MPSFFVLPCSNLIPNKSNFNLIFTGNFRQVFGNQLRTPSPQKMDTTDNNRQSSLIVAPVETLLDGPVSPIAS